MCVCVSVLVCVNVRACVCDRLDLVFAFLEGPEASCDHLGMNTFKSLQTCTFCGSNTLENSKTVSIKNAGFTNHVLYIRTCVCLRVMRSQRVSSDFQYGESTQAASSTTSISVVPCARTRTGWAHQFGR